MPLLLLVFRERGKRFIGIILLPLRGDLRLDTHTMLLQHGGWLLGGISRESSSYSTRTNICIRVMGEGGREGGRESGPAQGPGLQGSQPDCLSLSLSLSPLSLSLLVCVCVARNNGGGGRKNKYRISLPAACASLVFFFGNFVDREAH